MRSLPLTLLVVVLLVLAFAPLARATTIGEWDVTGLRPFTAETNYMSLPGYYRWLTFLDTGKWISWKEAVKEAKARR